MRRFNPLALILGASILLSSYPALAGQTVATWYGPGFVGKRMANGRQYNPRAFTAAHPSYPLGTRLRVTNRKTGRSVVVTVTDRCSCSLDLSKAAFRQLAPLRQGRVQVKYKRIN